MFLRMLSRASVLVPAALLGTVFAASAAAQAPPRVPVQGVVTDAEGAAVDATYTVVFSLYDVAEGGTPLYTEVQDVAFEGGFFATYLGNATDVPLELFGTTGTLYLGIAIDGDDEMDRIELATAPFAAFAQYAADSATLGGIGPDGFAPAVHTTPWDSLTDVPADLADGDNDTTYGVAAGGGIELSGNTFGLQSCASAGEVLKWTGAAWNCAVDEVGSGSNPTDELLEGFALVGTLLRVSDAGGTYEVDLGVLRDGNTTYSAGTGLTLTGTTFAANTSVLQTRVTGSCADGLFLRGITVEGNAICGVDQNSGASYGAGAGLTLTGSTFAVNTNAIQARIATACGANQYIRAVNTDGTPVCANDLDTNTTYTAGTGLTLSGTTFSINTSATQARIGSGCGAGQFIRSVNADGSVVCANDADTNSTYTAGFGLAASGNTFNVDQESIQRRVVGTCSTIGEFVWGVDAAGGVSCRNVFGQVETQANVHYGTTGLTGQANGWQPNPFGGSGVWIEGGSSESGGFYADGDLAAIWSPGDATVTLEGGAGTPINSVLLAVYDEDSISSGSTSQAAFIVSDSDSTRRLAVNNGAYLSAGGVWTNTSDQSLKTDIAPVNVHAVLEAVANLNITEWSYLTEQQQGFRHMGPMAQDFYAAFGLGYDDASIPTVDADGVALAAIQALYERNVELEAQVSDLEARLAAIEARLPR